MKKLCALAAFAALSVGQVGGAQAADVTAAIGQSGDSTMVYRLGMQWDWGSSWMQSDVGRLTGYWDLGYTYWDGDETASNHSVSLSPVFVYEFAGETVKPYIEAGIGVALFADTDLEDNDLGSSFQFEDRIGLGLRFVNARTAFGSVLHADIAFPLNRDGDIKSVQFVVRTKLAL